LKKDLFAEEEKWYQKEVIKTLHRIARAGSILEVNTRGIYKKKSSDPYPSPWILAHAKELNIPVVLNSDAHHPSEITQSFAETADLLKDIGFKELMVLVQGHWESRPFNAQGIDLD
ncbi:MAG: histidinol phosphatase, partial [Bacteroidota bacterium]